MAAIVPRLHVMRWAISGTVISLFARSHTIRFTSCSLRGQPCLAISTKPLPLFQRNAERLEATNFNVVFNSLKVYETNRMICCSGSRIEKVAGHRGRILSSSYGHFSEITTKRQLESLL